MKHALTGRLMERQREFNKSRIKSKKERQRQIDKCYIQRK